MATENPEDQPDLNTALRSHTAPTAMFTFDDLIHRIVLDEFAPAAVLIRNDFEVVSMIGPVVNYLRFPSVESKKNLLASARTGLRKFIRNTVQRAKETSETVADQSARVKRGGQYYPCSISVKPLSLPQEAAGMLLVTFQDLKVENKTAVKSQTHDEFLAQTQPTHILGLTSGAEDIQHNNRQAENSTFSDYRDLLSNLRNLNTKLESQVANQLRETHLLAEAISHLAEGVMVTDGLLDSPGPKILFVNDALCRATGYTRDELIGKTPRILQGPLTSLDSLAFIRTEMKHNRACTVELINYRKDGSVFHNELFITPLFDPFGVRSNFVSIQRDVSERTRSRHRLLAEAWQRESQYRLTRVLSESSTVIAAIPYILSSICEGLEWDLGEYWERDAQSQLMKRIFLFENAMVEDKQVSHKTETKAFDDLSFIENIWKNGTPNWLTDESEASGIEQVSVLPTSKISAYGFPVLNHGTVAGVFVFFSKKIPGPDVASLDQMEAFTKQVGDFIQRKQAERALYESEEKLRAVLETTHVAIITLDQKGIIQSANPAAQRMFQYHKDELVGHNVSMLMPKPYRDEHDRYIENYLATRIPKIIGIGREVTGVRKDGTIFPIDLAVSEIDHMKLFTGILRDISRRKELERQVLEISVNEQRRIGQELHDVTGQELTGLTLVAGTMLMLLSEKQDKINAEGNAITVDKLEIQQLQQIATRLTEGLKQAHRHVQQLSHGILPVQIEPVGLQAALEELAEVVSSNPYVSCTCDVSPLVEVADNTIATQLYRIAQEAVNNALRHSHAKHINLSLQLVGDEIVLEVADDGIGIISKETMGKEKSVRTGFGLGIMNYRASNIGANLKIMSCEPTGTCIRCTLRYERPIPRPTP